MLMGCRAEDLYEQHRAELPEDAQIQFTATVLEVRDDVRTRDLTQEPVPVNIDDYPNNFYIDMAADIPKEGSTETEHKTAIGTYIVPSGFAGQLDFKGDADQKKLNWWDIDSPHYFWSWTVPWAEPAKPSEPGDEDNGDENTENPGGSGDMGKTRDTGDEDDTEPGEPGDPDEPEEPNKPTNTPFNPLVPTTNPLTFTLEDTSLITVTVPEEKDDEDNVIKEEYQYRTLSEWENGAVMERFLGTKSGPYNYRENGRDVPLQFRHLVSKIIIESIEFLGADGSTHNDFPAEITFVNMPTTFTFYPHPTGEEKVKNAKGETYNLTADGAPIVITDYSTADPNGGLKFTALNRSEDYPRDMFYICPELDFTNIEFFVDIKDPENKYNTRGTYWGAFKNVSFERVGTEENPNPDYNNPSGGDERILHAGEEMHFHLVVQQFGGGGTSQWIRDWGNGTVSNAGHHTHPGIYSRGEAAEFLNKSGSQSEIFDLYGEGNTSTLWPDCPEYQQDKGIFRLYADVGTFERMSFPVDKGYILDGMGYTITLKRTGTSSNISLGMMRDVFIQIEDGILMYIDKDGNLFVMDAEGNYIETDYILNSISTSVNIDELAKLIP